MTPAAARPLPHEWLSAYNCVSAPVAHVVAEVVDAHLGAIAVAFYKELRTSEDAAHLIPPDVLHARLLPAIQRWMQFLFDPVNATGPSPTVALQRHIGEVHARSHIPIELVARGFRILKRALGNLLGGTDLGRQQLLEAALYVDLVADLALAEMRVAHARAEAATSAPSAPVHVGLEAERQAQLVAISDEEGRYLRSMLNAVSLSASEVPALGASPLGMWLNHKAPLLFADTPGELRLTRVAQAVVRLDADLLPRLHTALNAQQNPRLSVALLRDVIAGFEDIREQVNHLFDALNQAHSHRDALTQLLSRPLVDSILRREIELARRKRTAFSVLVVDIDHFADLQQQHGTTVGESVLQQVADMLTAQVRASDFVFRYGVQSFLLLLVELDSAQTLAVAEKIRKTVQCAGLALAPGGPQSVTLSTGVAVYQGETDPHALTALADQALSQAQSLGPNCVAMATG